MDDGAALFFMITVFVVLFWGDPDIHDKIIELMNYWRR